MRMTADPMLRTKADAVAYLCWKSEYLRGLDISGSALSGGRWSTAVGSGGGRSRGLRGGRARQYGDRWRVVRVASARPVGRCAAGWSFPVFVCVREWCGLANLP